MANEGTFLAHLKQRGRLIDNGDGTYSEQVAVVNGVSVLTVAVQQAWPNLPNPTYDTNGGSLGALAGVTVCSITGMAAGDYRVEFEMSSADTAAPGKYLFLLHNPGNKHVIYMPSPGVFRGVISRAPFAANDSLAIVVGAATAAGALTAGSIRAYRLA